MDILLGLTFGGLAFIVAFTYGFELIAMIGRSILGWERTTHHDPRHHCHRFGKAATR